MPRCRLIHFLGLPAIFILLQSVLVTADEVPQPPTLTPANTNVQPNEPLRSTLIQPAAPTERVWEHYDHDGDYQLDEDHGSGSGHDDDLKHNRPDTHAPAGMFGDHVHEQGEWMAEYKFMQMYMGGNRVGDTRVSSMQALDASGVAFAVTPTQMNMEMHMLHIMYGLTNNVTLYVMPMALSLSMDHQRRDTTTFSTHNDGFGDLVFGTLWRIYDGRTDELIVNLGASAPTGNIDEQTDTGMLFPYPMRLGSGTFNFRPGVTYKSYYDWGTIGLQFQGDLPVGTNYTGYSNGDQYWINLWGSYLVGPSKKLALTFRVENYWRKNINGFDRRIGAAPTNVSTNRPDMRGGYWLNFGYGAIYLMPGGSRINFEMIHPVYQFLDGVQLETDWTLAASWSKAF